MVMVIMMVNMRQVCVCSICLSVYLSVYLMSMNKSSTLVLVIIVGSILFFAECARKGRD